MMQFEIPNERPSIIKVIGVGGGGSNAVNHMYRLGIKGVDFMVCNTDQQSLETSPVPIKIQLGPGLTQGLGAGATPEIGRQAALENIDELREILGKNTKMIFITAGMGGGTGTGAAPIIARLAREMGILTVGIVTIPFAFEGKKRKSQADAGVEEMRKCVDTLLVICNDKLREIHGDLKLSQAFGHADDILAVAAKSIAEIITTTLHINVDYADIQTVMKNSGVAIMGSAAAEGENRASAAVSKALDSPLLNDNSIEGARYILLNITSGNTEITMDEMTEITDYVQEAAGGSADVIMGVGTDLDLGNCINVTVIATGFKTKNQLGSVIDEPEQFVKYRITGEILPEVNSNIEASANVSELEDQFSSLDSIKDFGTIGETLESVESMNLAFESFEGSELIEEDSSDEIVAEAGETLVHTLDIVTGEFQSEVVSDDIADEIESEEFISELESGVSSEIEQPESISMEFEFKAEESFTETTPIMEFKTESVSEVTPFIYFKHPSQDSISDESETEISEQENRDNENESDGFKLSEQQRLDRLRELNLKINTPNGVSSLEREPAYRRRGVQFESSNSSDTGISRLSLSTDNEGRPEIRPNNPFLHDRVD